MVVHEKAKSLNTDKSLADMLMAVDAGVEFFLRIVEMKRRQTLDADDLVKIGKRSLVTFLGANIIAGGESVLGIEADA